MAKVDGFRSAICCFPDLWILLVALSPYIALLLNLPNRMQSAMYMRILGRQE